MNLNSIKELKAFEEFRKNKRLQWLSLLVLVILLASALKSVSDAIEEVEQNTAQQQAMVTRLQSAASAELTEDELTEAREAVKRVLASAPSAPSASIAEAEALTKAEQQLLVLLKRSRANLVGTDVVEFGNEAFWEIRIELSGQLASKNLITLFSYFDGSNPYQRMASFQYRPKVSDDLSVVVDFLFRQERQ